MKQHTQEEWEKLLNELRDKIDKYLEWADNSYLEREESKTDILKAGLNDIDGDLCYWLED